MISLCKNKKNVWKGTYKTYESYPPVLEVNQNHYFDARQSLLASAADCLIRTV
jgi:hypothetical protein